MDIANLPRYEMGRCSSCGDCNREPEYLDSDGQWVKFEEAIEADKNSLQQLKAEILRICDEAEEQYGLKGMSEASTYFGAIRAKLSAV